MKCMIAFACLLAVASAGYIQNGVTYTSSYASPLAYTSYAATPISYVAPKSFGYSSSSIHPYGYTYGATPLTYTNYAHTPLTYSTYAAAPVALATEARQVDPVAIAAGAPLPTGDTVEVAAAKAAHFQAHAVAKGLTYGTPVAYAGYAKYAATPVAYSHYATAPVALATEARQVDPIAIAAGAPLPTGDTVEVAAAKAAHFQAHAAAKSMHFRSKRSPVYTAYTTPLAYSAYSPAHSYGYSSYAAPLAYSGYNTYGYNTLATPFYG